MAVHFVLHRAVSCSRIILFRASMSLVCVCVCVRAFVRVCVDAILGIGAGTAATSAVMQSMDSTTTTAVGDASVSGSSGSGSGGGTQVYENTIIHERQQMNDLVANQQKLLLDEQGQRMEAERVHSVAVEDYAKKILELTSELRTIESERTLREERINQLEHEVARLRDDLSRETRSAAERSKAIHAEHDSLLRIEREAAEERMRKARSDYGATQDALEKRITELVEQLKVSEDNIRAVQDKALNDRLRLEEQRVQAVGELRTQMMEERENLHGNCVTQKK